MLGVARSFTEAIFPAQFACRPSAQTMHMIVRASCLLSKGTVDFWEIHQTIAKFVHAFCWHGPHPLYFAYGSFWLYPRRTHAEYLAGHILTVQASTFKSAGIALVLFADISAKAPSSMTRSLSHIRKPRDPNRCLLKQS